MHILGIRKIASFGDKERENFKRLLKKSGLGDYVGYKLALMRKNSELLIIGTEGVIDCDIKYNKKTYEIIPVVETRVHYASGGRINNVYSDKHDAQEIPKGLQGKIDPENLRDVTITIYREPWFKTISVPYTEVENLIAIYGWTITNRFPKHDKVLNLYIKEAEKKEELPIPSDTKSWIDKYTVYKEKSHFAKGGHIGFAKLVSQVADEYEGTVVEPKYQEEYGKRYDKQEAEEVGRKVAGAIKKKLGK